MTPSSFLSGIFSSKIVLLPPDPPEEFNNAHMIQLCVFSCSEQKIFNEVTQQREREKQPSLGPCCKLLQESNFKNWADDIEYTCVKDRAYVIRQLVGTETDTLYTNTYQHKSSLQKSEVICSSFIYLLEINVFGLTKKWKF